MKNNKFYNKLTQKLIKCSYLNNYMDIIEEIINNIGVYLKNNRTLNLNLNLIEIYNVFQEIIVKSEV